MLETYENRGVPENLRFTALDIPGIYIPESNGLLAMGEQDAMDSLEQLVPDVPEESMEIPDEDDDAEFDDDDEDEDESDFDDDDEEDADFEDEDEDLDL